MPQKAHIRKHAVALFADKAPATVIGWIWKAVLVLTLKMMLIPRWRGEQASIQEARTAVGSDLTPARYRYIVPLIHVGTYVFILFASLLISKRTERAAAAATEAGRAKHAFRLKVLVMGMALLPAWAFKDVVASVMIDGRYGGLLGALLVLITATVASIALPSQSDVQVGSPLCLEVGARASGSLGLGVAFACNNVVQFLAGSSWDLASFQLVYSPFITVVMSVVRPWLVDFSAESSERNFLLKRVAFFLASTSSFFAAWAWNALIHRIFALLLPPCAGDDCVWRTASRAWIVALIVTGAAAAMLAALTAVHHTGKRGQTVIELLITAAGVNVGSFWTDAASATYDVAGPGLLHCWFLCGVLTIVVPLLALLLVELIDRIQPPEPEQSTSKDELGDKLLDAVGKDDGDGDGDGGGD